MKKLIALLLLAYVILLAAPVYAQQDYPRDLTLTWENAAEYVDGTLMEPGDLAMDHFDCFRQNDTIPFLSADIPANGEGLTQAETWTGVVIKPGTVRCEGYSITVDSVWSDPSAPAFKKYTGKPKALIFIKFE